MPPVGKSLWRKRVKDGDLAGIKAKTQYPAKPDSWPESDPWPPDRVLSLVQAGLLNGKSIGFLPLKVHVADEKAREKYGWPQEIQESRPSRRQRLDVTVDVGGLPAHEFARVADRLRQSSLGDHA